jgi:hypothetical protein
MRTPALVLVPLPLLACLTVASCAGPRSAEPELATTNPPVETPSAEPAPEPAPVAVEPERAAATFERTSQGWRAHTPSDWTMLGELDDELPNGSLHKTVFELPKVWSELEGQPIANAVSVSSIRRHVVSDARSFQFEHSLLHPDLPHKLLDGTPRLAARDTVNWDGLNYEVQLEYVVRDRMGYVVEFIATPGTFATNYPLFRAFSDSLELFEPKQD